MSPAADASNESAPAASRLAHVIEFLTANDLDHLRPLLEAIEHKFDEVVSHWRELHEAQFSNSDALKGHEFERIFGSWLRRCTRALLKRDLKLYVTHINGLVDELSEREQPFSEVIVSLHLYWQSALRVLERTSALSPSLYESFNKLNHVRMILVADGYFRSWAARRGLKVEELEHQAARLPSGLRRQFHGLVGTSAPMRHLYQKISAAAANRATVLIVGESGTGKELVARAIHQSSPTPDSPFVALNCAAIPKELIESEMFGYAKGAFSGASADHLGLFRAAAGGTLFLDEISEMSPDTQAKLLRAIQEKTVRPVGATREIGVDVRVIASTNREPETAMREGQLRADLYYRLQMGVLRVPPLRERLGDIPLLVEHFIRLFNEQMRRVPPVLGIEAPALEVLQQYGWPGNVRELSNALGAAFTFGTSSMIRVGELRIEENAQASVAPVAGRTSVRALAPEQMPKFEDVERDLIRRTLERTGGNKAKAARLLGISRKKLYSRMIRYGMES